MHSRCCRGSRGDLPPCKKHPQNHSALPMGKDLLSDPYDVLFNGDVGGQISRDFVAREWKVVGIEGSKGGRDRGK